jgi:hypothetical protein
VLHHLARHVIPLTGDPILAQFQKSHFDFVFVTHSDVVDRPETLRAVPGGLCELGLDENVQIVAQDVLRFQFDHLPPVLEQQQCHETITPPNDRHTLVGSTSFNTFLAPSLVMKNVIAQESQVET